MASVGMGYSSKIGGADDQDVQIGSAANCPDGLVLGSDFPYVCEVCLGPNPYVRMIKMQYGCKECKITSKPYQPFRWRAGQGGRYKQTIISYEVARQKNVCQACLIDMQFGLPVAVRDSILGEGQGQDLVTMPESEVGKAYYFQVCFLEEPKEPNLHYFFS